ncbi:hypothetical protein Tco_0175110 [Tanacetum coccineum]
MAYDKDNNLEQEEEGGESVSGTLAAGASGGMISMNNTNQESQCLKTLTKEEGVECVHDQEIKNDERKCHNEPVSGMTSGCSGGMLTMSSAAGRGFGRAYALQQQQQQSGHGSVLVGPPSGRGFRRGHAPLHRHVRNEDPPNQHPNPDQVSDHELISFDPASMGTDVTGAFGEMLTLMSRGEEFGQAYAQLHQSVFNNEQVPATHPDPVTVPDDGPLATYIDNAKKNAPKRRTKKK